jgi:hypothetical protein
MRRLCELQTVRAGIVGGRTEWRNRIGSGLGDDTATKLAAATIEHFTRQLEAVDRAIAETIDQDAELRGRRDLLLSVIGVGETLAALLLAEMPEPGVLRRSSEVVAYAGLNPSHHRSGTSIDRPTRISKIGNAGLRSALYMPALAAMRFDPAIAAPQGAPEECGPAEAQADRGGGDAQAPGPLLRRAEDRQAVRSRHRHAGLSLGGFPIPLFDRGGHSAVPICPLAGRRAQRRPRRVAGPRAPARLVLDRGEHAGTLRQIDGGLCTAGQATRYLPARQSGRECPGGRRTTACRTRAMEPRNYGHFWSPRRSGPDAEWHPYLFSSGGSLRGGGNDGCSPAAVARSTVSERVRAPIRSMTWARWASTVRGLIASALAVSLLVAPASKPSSTSRSRAESAAMFRRARATALSRSAASRTPASAAAIAASSGPGSPAGSASGSAR